MGGDNAPGEIVAGALQALASDPDIEVALVGRPEAIDQALATAGRDRLSVVAATEVVEMDEHPANAVRSKKDASINVATRLVADGKADAVVSAGNSGGIMAAAVFGLRRIKGLERPAIGTLLPSKTGQTFLLDAGANTDVKPSYLAQFALLGDAYARKLMGIASPRVGLLSNGEEEGKGNALVVEAHELLKALPINFIGNVEGKELFSGGVDVVVTDGFTGNIVLKTIEGVAEFLFTTIRDEVKKSPIWASPAASCSSPAWATSGPRPTGARWAAPSCWASTAWSSSPTAAPTPRRSRTRCSRPPRPFAVTLWRGWPRPSAGRPREAQPGARRESHEPGTASPGVVTGLGTVNPVANDADGFYDALIEGKSGVAKLEGWDAESNPSQVAGQIKNLNIEDHLDAKEIRRTARFTQIAIVAARQTSVSGRGGPAPLEKAGGPTGSTPTGSASPTAPRSAASPTSWSRFSAAGPRPTGCRPSSSPARLATWPRRPWRCSSGSAA